MAVDSERQQTSLMSTISTAVASILTAVVSILTNSDSLVTGVQKLNAHVFAAANTGTGAGGAATTITKMAAGTGSFNVLAGVEYSYDTTPANGALTITDDGVTVFSIHVPTAGPGNVRFDPPIKNAVANKALVVVLAAPGGAVVGKLNLNHWVE